MCVFIEEVYFIGVSARHKGDELKDCPYREGSENRSAWMLGFKNGHKLPSLKEARDLASQREGGSSFSFSS